MQQRHLTLARGAALVAALALAACGERAADAPEGAAVNAAATGAAEAPGPATPAPHDKLAADTRLAFVHTANVVGELEPCG